MNAFALAAGGTDVAGEDCPGPRARTEQRRRDNAARRRRAHDWQMV